MNNPVGAPRRIFVEPGQRFGKGTVLGEIEGSKRPRMVLLRCDCGAEYKARLGNLIHEVTKSCGCLLPRGGLRHHPLRASWYAMLYRCENTGHDAYPRYGGRGIRVCEEWHDFRTFADDIDRILGPRPEGHTLDRVDNDGPYAAWNVRWAPPPVQNRNRPGPKHQKLTAQDAIIYTARHVNGETLSALAREAGVHASVMNRRVGAVLRYWEEFWASRAPNT